MVEGEGTNSYMETRVACWARRRPLVRLECECGVAATLHEAPQDSSLTSGGIPMGGLPSGRLQPWWTQSNPRPRLG